MFEIQMSDLKKYILIGYAIYLGVMSLITFILYLVDKRKAINGSWRIPEKVLLLFSFFGGAFGGFPSMLIFRHKTRGEHWYFTAINLLGIVLHAGLVFCILFIFTL